MSNAQSPCPRAAPRRHPRRPLRERRGRRRAAAPRRRAAAPHRARRARARRPRADRDRRRQPAHRLPRLAPTTRASLDELRLADGTVWPLPLTLAVRRGHAPSVVRGRRGRARRPLRTALGRDRRRPRSSRATRSRRRATVYGTDDPAHPGVAYLLARPRTLVGGPVRVLPLPEDLPVRRAPADAARAARRDRRARLEARRRLPDPQPDPPRARAPDQARARVRRRARHPPAGRRDQGRRRAGRRALPGLRGADRRSTTRATARCSPRSPRPCATRARARRSSTRSCARTTASPPDRGPRPRGRRPLLRPLRGAADLRPLHARASSASTPLQASSRRSSAAPATRSPRTRTCPHDAGARGSSCRARRCARSCASGGRLPARVHAARGRRGAARALHGRRRPRRRAAPRPRTGGFIVWFTGLSGAGKSTLAEAPERAARPSCARSRSSTATRCARTCRRASASRKRGPRHQHPPHRLRGAAAGAQRRRRDHRRDLALRARSATRCGACAEAEGIPFVEVFADAPIEALADARREGPLPARRCAGELAALHRRVRSRTRRRHAPDVVVRSDRETVEREPGAHRGPPSRSAGLVERRAAAAEARAS